MPCLETLEFLSEKETAERVVLALKDSLAREDDPELLELMRIDYKNAVERRNELRKKYVPQRRY